MALFLRDPGTVSQKLILLFLLLLLPFIGRGQQNQSQALQKADSLRHAARYDSSNTYYRQAVQQFEKKQAWLHKAEALYKLSLNKLAQDQVEESAHFLEQAFKLSQSRFPSDTTFNIKYHYQKATIAEASAKYDSALSSYQKGMALAATSDQYISWQTKLITGMGEAYTSKGNYPRATRAFSRAEDMYQQNKLDEKKLLSRIYNSYGTAFQHMGSYEKALIYYRQSL